MKITLFRQWENTPSLKEYAQDQELSTPFLVVYMGRQILNCKKWPRALFAALLYIFPYTQRGVCTQILAPQSQIKSENSQIVYSEKYVAANKVLPNVYDMSVNECICV